MSRHLKDAISNTKVYFKIFDHEENKEITSEDKDIEFLYHGNGALTIWRIVNKTMKLGDLEADVECYDFIMEYEILELHENEVKQVL